jgi:hypothetical protein
VPPALFAPLVSLVGFLSDDGIQPVKAAIAFAGALLLAWRWWAGRKGPVPKVWGPLFAAVSLIAVLGFWNFGKYHFPGFFHSWDVYGNYMGAKYFDELEYTRLYECVALADSQDAGIPDVRGRRIRNLATNKLEVADWVFTGPVECRGRFTDARWQAFKRDAAWLRATTSEVRWYEMQQDHGYNGTPVWGLVAGALANRGPASPPQMDFLTALDPLLLILMWFVCVRTFGWVAAGVAAIFWGTNYMGRFWWNGGSFLRMDWLFLSVIAICLLKAGRPRAAGFALGWAGLIRVFPFALVIGLVLRVLARSVRGRRLALAGEDRRLAEGLLLSFAVLVPLSMAAAGPRSWIDFVANSRKHLGTPLTNNVGLKTALAFPFSAKAAESRRMNLMDAFGDWKAGRRKAEARTAVPFFLAAAGLAALAARAAERHEAWVAAALGACLVPIFTQLTCYYESILLAAGLLWLIHPAVGVLVCALAGSTCLLPSIWWWDDQRYFAASVLIILTVAATFLLVARSEPPAPRAAPAPAKPAGGGGRRKPTGRARA